ncbi:MAG: PaaI family thioesterase [Castellaniella sp.]
MKAGIAPSTGKPALITAAGFRELLEREHPFATLLIMEILEIGHGSARLRLPDQPEHQRQGGTVAGPMLMALADVALYAAVVGATGEPRAVTASLSINFMRAAPPGGVLAHAHIHRSGRLASGECCLYTADGSQMIAQAISAFALPAQAAQKRPQHAEADH